MATRPNPQDSGHHLLRLLIVEDNPADVELEVAWLRRAGYPLSFEAMDHRSDFQAALGRNNADLVLCDHNLRDWNGLEALEILKQSGRNIPFVVVTATLGDEAAVEYIKQGAADYVLKHRLERLPVAVRQALRDRAHREEAARLQEQVLAGKREWELTFDSVPNPVMLVNVKGDILRANQAVTQVTGKKFAEIIGRPCCEVFPCESGNSKCPHQLTLATGGFSRRDELVEVEGRLLECTANPLRDPTGNLSGTVIVLHDLTERHRVEERVLAERQRLFAVLDCVPVGICLLTPDFQVPFSNRSFRESFGDAQGRHCYEFCFGLAAPCEFCKSFEPLKTAQPYQWEVTTPKGRIIDVHDFPFQDADGSPMILEMDVDITEARRAREALRESEERFRTAFQASPEPMTLSRLADGRYVDVNEAFLRFVGFDRESVIGRSPLELNTWTDLAARADMFKDLREHRRVRDRQLEFRTRTGEIRTLLVSAESVEVAGELCALAISVDVTERQQLERQFLQAQKMEAVGRLAGGVAHDFNNLLTIINGYTEMMLDRAVADGRERSHLDEVRRAGERASALTRQLLAFSRKQVVVPAVLDLNTTIEGIREMLRRLIREDIVFHSSLAEGLGQITADAGQVEQVIMNLAVNARDAMPKGGQLTVETANLELGEEYCRAHPYISPGRYVMLAISDTGCGMDPETQSHVFEPFFTTKEPGKGSGLGLSTVYGIVKQSGGHINVYSEVGRGTTIRVYFPRIDGAVEGAGAQKVQQASEGGHETILLVEDEPGVRQLTENALRENGYTVLSASDSAEALAMWEKRKDAIELLLTDVVMPGMSGKDLADRLTVQRPETKVLFISGYTADAIARHGILEEGVAFLAKPFTPRELLAKLRQTLDK